MKDPFIASRYNGVYGMSLCQMYDFIRFVKDTSFLVEKWKIMTSQNLHIYKIDEWIFLTLQA